MAMKRIKEVLGLSIIQAVGASLVVWLWSIVMSYGEKWFGSDNPGMAGWVAIPLIFMVVAVLSAGSVLGYPLYLVLHKKTWGQAVTLLLLTILWLAIIATLLIFVFRK